MLKTHKHTHTFEWLKGHKHSAAMIWTWTLCDRQCKCSNVLQQRYQREWKWQWIRAQAQFQEGEAKKSNYIAMWHAFACAQFSFRFVWRCVLLPHCCYFVLFSFLFSKWRKENKFSGCRIDWLINATLLKCDEVCQSETQPPLKNH